MKARLRMAVVLIAALASAPLSHAADKIADSIEDVIENRN